MAYLIKRTRVVLQKVGRRTCRQQKKKAEQRQAASAFLCRTAEWHKFSAVHLADNGARHQSEDDVHHDAHDLLKDAVVQGVGDGKHHERPQTGKDGKECKTFHAMDWKMWDRGPGRSAGASVMCGVIRARRHAGAKENS